MTKWEKGVQPYMDTHGDKIILDKIRTLKNELSDKIVILGHHYQRDDIMRFADFRGDSLVLSRQAAETDRENIVFCGVRFMAECADILARENQKVFLPNANAGCSMADMANVDEVQKTWNYLLKYVSGKIIPVTYINSSAEIKAFVGKNGGIVCTSSNAPKIFDWALTRGDHVLFLPDQFLGMNTALHSGLSKDDYIILDENIRPLDLKKRKVFLWNGYCSVHKLFSPSYIQKLKIEYPNIQIVVHGECRHEVVQMADHYGSTSTIIKKVKDSPAGSVWGIGTEEHLVHRLATQHPDKIILSLSASGYQCETMSMITPENLLTVLQEIRDGAENHRLTVDQSVKPDAMAALRRMLEIS